MYKLIFFVPKDYVEQVKEAVFAAGAGQIGQYQKCCWQTPGIGQFQPMEGSQPYIGEQGLLETVDEYRVEMVCESEFIREAVAALKQAHPYEEPAYDVTRLETF